MRRIGLIFHGIGAPARAMEPGEPPYWVTVAQFEAILDQIRAHPQADRMEITFDDGNISDYDIALPHLLARGLRAHFFVLAGRIGKPGSLDIDHIQALQAAGMRIGSHGVGHVDWRRLDDAALSEELSESRRMLESICGRPVVTAGIPFGSYDARVLKALHRAGYEAAYSSDRGAMNPAAFLRPRTSITGSMSATEVAGILAGQIGAAARLRRMLGMARRRLMV